MRALTHSPEKKKGVKVENEGWWGGGGGGGWEGIETDRRTEIVFFHCKVGGVRGGGGGEETDKHRDTARLT